MVDFSKIRGSKISVLKATRQEAEKKSYSGNSKRPGFLEIKEGYNAFRIAPPSDPELPSYFPLRTAWLEVDLPKLDDNGNEVKKDGKVVIEKKKKRIFIATIHGDNLHSDPIELFCHYVNKKANDEIQDKDLRMKYLSPVNGFKDKKGVWTPGIRPNTNYVFYAWDINKNFGRLEVYPQVLKKMDELSISENKDEVIEIDPFSCPVNGVSLIIDYDKSGKSGEKYKVSKKTFDFAFYINKYGDETRAISEWKKDKESEKLTQAQLEEWASKEPLVNMYKNVYCMRDFELAVNGLRNFDQAQGYGIFENDEFLAELEKIQKLVPEKNPNAVDQDSDIKEAFEKKDNPPSTPKQEVSGNTTNDHSTWNKIKCRKKLEAYILDNYGNDQILPDLDLETMRVWCSLVDAGEELPFDEVEETSQTDGKSEIEKEAEQANAIKANKDFDKENQPNSGLNESQASKIAALRKKAGK